MSSVPSLMVMPPRVPYEVLEVGHESTPYASALQIGSNDQRVNLPDPTVVFGLTADKTDHLARIADSDTAYLPLR